MRAAVLVTGDEILRGRIQELNAGHLARSLDSLGIEVSRWEMVSDDLLGVSTALTRLMGAGVDLVCVTGGLGPTHDDVTMEAVAQATGRALELDLAALALVEARSLRIAEGSAADVLRAVQRKQALLPVGAKMLPPPGTAPGCLLDHDGVVVAVLPGPPWELATMWEDALVRDPLAGVLARAAGDLGRVLRIHAVPESLLVAAIEGFPPDDWRRLRVGICARDGELEVTVRSSPSDVGSADALEDMIAAGVGDALYSRDGATVDEVVARRLRAAGQTVAVAESCTGGGLGARLTALPGSSDYVLGGVISYADEVKTALLGVDPAVISRHGAVSAECAEAMAVGARTRLGSDWALAITGVAGPGGGTPEKPVGLVHIARAGPGGVVHAVRRRGGGREAIRSASVAAALHLLREALPEPNAV